MGSLYTRCINSKVTRHQDYDRTALINHLLKESAVLFSDFTTKPEFVLGDGTLSEGTCVIRCKRTSGIYAPSNKEFVAVAHLVGSETIDVTGDKKVFIEIPEWFVNDWTTINGTASWDGDQRLGLAIAEIKSQSAWPAHDNYIKLREITGWDRANATDLRVVAFTRSELLDLANYVGTITGTNLNLTGSIVAWSGVTATDFVESTGGSSLVTRIGNLESSSPTYLLYTAWEDITTGNSLRAGGYKPLEQDINVVFTNESPNTTVTHDITALLPTGAYHMYGVTLDITSNNWPSSFYVSFKNVTAWFTSDEVFVGNGEDNYVVVFNSGLWYEFTNGDTIELLIRIWNSGSNSNFTIDKLNVSNESKDKVFKTDISFLRNRGFFGFATNTVTLDQDVSVSHTGVMSGALFESGYNIEVWDPVFLSETEGRIVWGTNNFYTLDKAIVVGRILLWSKVVIVGTPSIESEKNVINTMIPWWNYWGIDTTENVETINIHTITIWRRFKRIEFMYVFALNYLGTNFVFIKGKAIFECSTDESMLANIYLKTQWTHDDVSELNAETHKPLVRQYNEDLETNHRYEQDSNKYIELYAVYRSEDDLILKVKSKHESAAAGFYYAYIYPINIIE